MDCHARDTSLYCQLMLAFILKKQGKKKFLFFLGKLG